MRRAILFLLALTCIACQDGDRQPPVWFVHFTDPHLFDRADDKKLQEMKEEDRQKAEKKRKLQEGLSQRALADLLRAAGALPGTDAKPAFLVVTGDFGIDRVVGDKASEQVLADLLAASPVRDVYFVPGNNDVPGESEDLKVLESTRDFFGRVEGRLAGRVVLHDLTACYYLPGTPCEADIPGTEIRLIGFPTHSFKNSETDGAFKTNQPFQEAHVDRLAALVKRAEADGRKALILTHIAELDDPHDQAQNRFAGQKPSRQAFQPRWSAWNVSLKVYQRWKDIVDSRAVAGVLAGHFHDNHREIYYPPYQWSQAAGNRADPAKVLLAPPLGVRLQDASPRQARGFALVRLDGNRVSRRMYWYHPARGIFQPDPARVRRAGGGWPGWNAGVAWLWSLGGATAGDSGLARAAVVAIAFLAAFLTLVQIWQIPPPDTRLTDPSRPAEPAKPAAGAAAPAKGALPSPTGLLANTFASTVLSGLGGLALVSFLDAFWDQSKIQAKAYYLVLFVFFFLALLILSSLLRALAEALRSRVVLGVPSVSWPPRLISGAEEREEAKGNVEPRRRSLGSWDRFIRWFGYWRRRIWTWMLSFRTTVLTLGDTFFNLIQGQNQLQTEVFSDAIIRLHWSIVWAADRVREQVDLAVCAALRAKGATEEEVKDRAVRVSISLLAADESSAYYVSREPGTLGKAFDRFSVAWVAIYTGEARWVRMGQDKAAKDWDEVYARNTEAELYDNRGRSIPGEEGKVMLTRYFQTRESSDYGSFIVLPFPWAHRGRDVHHRRGGLHISFRSPKHIGDLWSGLEAKEGEKEKPAYKGWQGLLGSGELRLLDPELHELAAVLDESLAVLAELFAFFNDSIFHERIKPHLRL